MKKQETRITSIDALRAIVLLGILLVHTIGLFGFRNPSNSFVYFTEVDRFLINIINSTLTGRCNIVFSILFGVSFYLILQKPQYRSIKFIYRCFLLLLLGIAVKFFYTYDALMWYGITGIILTFFRNAKPKYIFLAFCIFSLLTLCLTKLSIGNIVFNTKETERYIATNSLYDVINYPLINSIVDYLRIGLNDGIFKTLSCFILGYFFAKAGVVDNLQKNSNIRNVLIFGVLYALFSYFCNIANTTKFVFVFLYNLFGSLFYTISFLYLYYKIFPNKTFTWLESYGKLGLTNYVMQNIVGVIIMSAIFIPYRFQFTSILVCSIVFYLIQLLFSVVWLRYYKYGPLEYIWRILTNMRMIPNRKNP